MTLFSGSLAYQVFAWPTSIIKTEVARAVIWIVDGTLSALLQIIYVCTGYTLPKWFIILSINLKCDVKLSWDLLEENCFVLGLFYIKFENKNSKNLTCPDSEQNKYTTWSILVKFVAIFWISWWINESLWQSITCSVTCKYPSIWPSNKVIKLSSFFHSVPWWNIDTNLTIISKIG